MIYSSRMIVWDLYVCVYFLYYIRGLFVFFSALLAYFWVLIPIIVLESDQAATEQWQRVRACGRETMTPRVGD